MSNHYDASSLNANNFNNFDPSTQYQSQYHIQQQQNFQAGGINHQSQQMYNQQQQQFYGHGQSSSSSNSSIQQNLNNGPTSTYQHTINDLLVQHPTSSYQQQQPQQNLYNNQIQTNQSVSFNLQ